MVRTTCMDNAGAARTSMTLLLRLRRSPADQAAWKEFVERYAPMIHGWCRLRNLQDADALDVTQIVLQKLAERMADFEYDPSRSFRAWLKTLTYNVWTDVLRQRRGLAGSGDSAVLSLLDNLEARDCLLTCLERTYEQELLDAAMARVRQRVQPHTWEAFRLTALEGQAGAAVAAALGQDIASVYKAKSNVQKLLQEEIRSMDK